MGASQSFYDRTGQVRLYEYPYGPFQKVSQFPYRFFFENSIFVRCLFAGFVVTLPICLMIQRQVNSKENREKWKKIRLARKHGFFDPPQPVEYPKQPSHWW